ncbi:hypothetical protein BDN70DRAFT_821319 [Pholiota conissans]|uniref:CENP-V/GFA domain-containing protein n=1 Tax=Pholiota conissans TaxID=109636 RepID=A0A9P6CLB8_9AGAR|nr:hypothetical protein BDN70DRAFT_821319 [Pholiota conissans]
MPADSSTTSNTTTTTTTASTPDQKLRTGSCLCGGVRYEVRGEPITTRVCHCANCKKATGAAFMTNGFFKEGQIRTIQGADLLKSFPDLNTESGTPLNRFFCSVCGSNVFLRSDPSGTRYDDIHIIALGTLDAPVEWSE